MSVGSMRRRSNSHFSALPHVLLLNDFPARADATHYHAPLRKTDHWRSSGLTDRYVVTEVYREYTPGPVRAGYSFDRPYHNVHAIISDLGPSLADRIDHQHAGLIIHQRDAKALQIRFAQ